MSATFCFYIFICNAKSTIVQIVKKWLIDWLLSLYQFNMLTGKTCTDPGRPADGIQDMSRSDKTYEKDKLIYFKCQRPGFDLSFSTPFKCEVSNNVAKWNESKLPECVGKSSTAAHTSDDAVSFKYDGF